MSKEEAFHMRHREEGHFTDREDQILALIAMGHRDKEIAAQLGISRKTVGTHLHRIYERHGLRSRAAAVAAWLRSERPRESSYMASDPPGHPARLGLPGGNSSHASVRFLAD